MSETQAATATSAPRRDDVSQRVVALETRLDAIEAERFRFREVVREAARRTASFARVILVVSLVLSVVLGGVRLAFLGSAWGDRARRLAEREAVTYVRAVTPDAVSVVARCGANPYSPTCDYCDMLCVVVVNGVRREPVLCDDDEPGYNDGCLELGREGFGR